MPNWVYQKLSVSTTGTEESKNDLKRFKELITDVEKSYVNKEGNEVKYQETLFDFNKIIPMPNELSIEIASDSSFAMSLLLYLKEHPHGSLNSVLKNHDKIKSGFKDVLKRSLFGWDYFDAHETFKEHFENFKNKSPIGPDEEGSFKVFVEQYTFSEEAFANARQFIDNLGKYGFVDWYTWRVTNWGTKWNSCGVDIQEDKDDFLLINYETAWSLPTPILETICKQYPNLNFDLHYYEESHAFAGTGVRTVGESELFDFVHVNDDEEIDNFIRDTFGIDSEE